MWRSLPRGSEKNGRNNFEGGLNTGLPSFDVKDDQYIEGSGWDTFSHPALGTRKPRTAYGASGEAITYLLTNFGNTHLFRAVGSKLQYDNAGTWTDISSGFNAIDWDSTNFDIGGAALIVTNGTDNVKYWDGSTLADLNATDAPKGKYIASDNRRVYIAVGDVVNYCAFQDAQDWTTALNSGAVQYYTSNGGDITAMKAYNGQVVIFKKDAMALIFHTGDSRATHRLVEQSNDVGCVSFKTLHEVGPYLMWLGFDDVYIYSPGAYPTRIGQPIRDYIADINQTHIDKCFGGTDGTRYFLGLVTGANTDPNVLLIYDPRRDRKVWHVQSLVSNFRYAGQINNQLYIGDNGGQTYKINDGSDYSNVDFTVTTKDFDEGMPEAQKEYYELHLQIYAPTGTTLTVEASTDQGGTYTSIGNVSTESKDQNVNIIVPLDTVDLTNWIRFRLSGSGEFTLYNIQRYFRIQPIQH